MVTAPKVEGANESGLGGILATPPTVGSSLYTCWKIIGLQHPVFLFTVTARKSELDFGT